MDYAKEQKPQRAKRDRNNPERRKSSESDYSLMEFMAMFPNDAACLDRLWRDRFAPDGHHVHCPKCGRERKFHRTKTRASYTCDTCGLHIHPMKGTIFAHSSTSLHLWFYAMYLMASTRCGISAKQMEREIGVTYKQAHKMMKRIRTELMTDDGEPLSGDVEIDETSWGGKPKRPHGESRYAPAPDARERARQHASEKPTVLGMVERGGRVRARVIASRHGAVLSRAVLANVNPDSIIFTDDWASYKPLRRTYIDHKIIDHSQGSTCAATRTRTPLRASSATSRPGCVAPTRRCLPPICSRTSTSTPGGTTRNSKVGAYSGSC